MADPLAFFLEVDPGAAQYQIQQPFGPVGDIEFNRGITFQGPNAFTLHAVAAGILKYDHSKKELRLSDFKERIKPNVFEHVSAFIYQGVVLDFDTQYNYTTNDNIVRRAFDSWSGQGQSYPYSEFREDLEYLHDRVFELEDVYLEYAAAIRDGRRKLFLAKEDVQAGSPIGQPESTFSFIIETTTPIRSYDNETNLFDPASFWKIAQSGQFGLSIRNEEDEAAVETFLQAAPSQYVLEIRDEFNTPLTRPPGSADATLDAPQASALTLTVPGSPPISGVTLPRGVYTLNSPNPITIQVASIDPDLHHQCVFWDSHIKQPNAPHISVPLPDPPFHLIIQVLRPADWFALQGAIFDNDFTGEQRPIMRYTRGNLVTPLIDGRAYFADLVSTLDELAGNSSVYPGFWHMAGWSMDAAVNIVPGRTMEQLLRQHVDNIILMLWNFEVIPGPYPFENLFIDYRTRTEQASEIPPPEQVLYDQKHQFRGAIHMKIATIDTRQGLIAYCGGIDVWRDRLNDQTHDDSRTDGELGQHDIQLKLIGPAANEIDLGLYQRWTDQRGEDPNFPVSSQTGNPIDFQLVQVARTAPAVTREVNGRSHLSFAIGGDLTIRETLLNAISRARNYIYIEDQFFSNYLIADALAERLNNGLQFLVIVIPQKNWTGSGKHPFVFDDPPDELAERIRERYPNAADNVRICSLIHPQTGEWIYVHAKLQIIDDIFVSCGSGVCQASCRLN